MMSHRLLRIAPTLLALGLLPAAAWGATSAAERDAHLDAVKSLIERDFRLPAQRQLAAFAAAEYPDAAWHGKFLAWFYADRFRALSPDPAEKAKLEAEAKALFAELDAAKAQLPQDIQDQIGGAGKIFRLINDLLRVCGQDSAPHQLGAQAIIPEQRAALNSITLTLIGDINAYFKEGLAKIQAHQKAEEDALLLEETDPKFLTVAQEAVRMRAALVRPVYWAHLVLREIAERGNSFGLDPAPARDFLKDFASKNFKTLEEWDFNWGGYDPSLRHPLLDLCLQAARFKVPQASIEDIAGEMQALVDIDINNYKQAGVAVQEEIRTLQVKAAASLVAFYREAGRDVAPKYFQRGLEVFQQFKEKYKSDRSFRLDHPNHARVVELARLHFQVGRLQKAKGDPAAVGTFGLVSSVRTHPLAGNAAAWAAWAIRPEGETTISSGATWGEVPVASDPAIAILTGGALLKAARTSGDPALQRQSLLSAAVTLRNGVLGLGSAAYAETADELAPEVWARYCDALSQLGMRWHAALAAQAGLRDIATRLAANKGAPWKERNGTWNAKGRLISTLARNSFSYTAHLRMAGNSSAVSALTIDITNLVRQVSPDDAGKSQDISFILSLLAEKDWRAASTKIDEFVKAYPEESYRGASLRAMLNRGAYDAAKTEAEKKTIAERALKEADATAKQAEAELLKTTDPARKRVLNQALREGQALTAFFALRQGKNEVVLDLLGQHYWQNPPGDESTTIEMLGYLCQAMRNYFEELSKDEQKRGDAAQLIANWPRTLQSYEIWKVQHERFPAAEERIGRLGGSLARVFQIVAAQTALLRRADTAPAELGAIEATANRAFADLIEPTLGPKSRPGTLLGVANVLWDLDEHPRAGRLYELYLAQIGDDPELAALREAPKDALAELDGLISQRPELRSKWNEAKDLLIDDPQLPQRIIEGNLPPDQWGEKKRDFVAAVVAIRALREEVGKGRITLGANFKPIDDGLARLDAMVTQLGRTMAVNGKLAQAYSEQGEKGKANAIYSKLIAYDPTNPDFLAAAVQLTIDQIKDGKTEVSEAQKKTALIQAARVREQAQNGTPAYWTAKIQTLELSITLGDTKEVNGALRFDAVNQSTPADDLQLLPRQKRDDKRVRRARNAVSIDLCRRYLALFQQPGITEKPNFTLVDSELDGKPVTLFVPLDAPKFTVHTRELDNGTTVRFFWEEGKEPPPEPEPAPAPAAPPTEAAPAPAPAPAQPAPPAQPEAKP